MRIAGLLLYLKSTEGIWVEEFFTPTVLETANEMIWDEETQTVISPMDVGINDIFEGDLDYHFTIAKKIVIITNTPARTDLPTEGGTAAYARDSDSVSTFEAQTAQSSSYKLKVRTHKR
jgi:hypothetical protein